MINSEDIGYILEKIDVSFWKDETVLITGATGFIGRNLVKVFVTLMENNKKGKVIAVCRNKSKAEKVFESIKDSEHLIIQIENLLEPLDIKGDIDYIIHAASISTSKNFSTKPVDVITANVMGTKNLLDVSVEKKIKGFLFLSSGAIYGDDSKAERDVKESEYFSIDSLEVRNCYALSKKMGENLCVSYEKQYDVPAKIIRIAHTYGPGIDLEDGHVYSDFVRNVLKNENILLRGTGQNKRPFCYISDAIVAMLLILWKGKNGNAYNMANNNEFMSIKELAEKICYEVFPERKLQVTFEKEVLEQNKEEKLEVSIDTSKLESIGWKPQIDVIEGIRKTVKGFEIERDNKMSKEVIAFSEAYKTNRTILKDVLPIEIPMCISIEPTNICNFKCIMCFQGTEKYMNTGAPFQNMTMECFDKIIDDLKEWTKKTNKIKIVKLYSTGEPLVNKNIGEMVKKIKEADICENVEITTNGSLLTTDLAEQFVDYGLDYLRISVYSVESDKNKSITQSNVLPKEIRDRVIYLRKYRDSKGKKLPYISAKMIDSYSEENDKFQEMYKDIADEAYIDKIMNLSTGESTVEKYYGNNNSEILYDIQNLRYFKEKKACRYPFTHMTIRSNGAVVVCCEDWSLKTKYGEVEKKSLQEIWESRELYEFRKMTLLTKGNGCEACKNCELPLRDFPEDNIDDFPLEKLTYSEKKDSLN